jgi:putative sterol carrier protein
MEKEELADKMAETFREKLNAMASANKGWNKKIEFCLDDINIRYRFTFQEDGTVPHIGKKPIEAGKAEPADATVHLTVDTMEGLMNKKINPVMAMTQGLLKIEGDMSALTRLAPVLM